MELREPDFMKMIADDVVPSAELNFIQDQDHDWIRQEVERLSIPQQQAIRMAFMEFKTHKEIAKDTGIPLGTVKTRIRSAIQLLKANMSESQRR